MSLENLTKTTDELENVNTNENKSSINNLTNDDDLKRKRLNRTERKYLKYKFRIENYKRKKEQKKKKSKINEKKEENLDILVKDEETSNNEITKHNYETYLNKRELKQKLIDRLNQVYSEPNSYLKICIDCSFSDKMSNKEMSRLAQQIGRCYATNKTILKPVHLTLCNLDENSKFYKELSRVNDGFSKYILKITDKTLEQSYNDRLDTLCYLTPDSNNHLEDLDLNKIYVIGGLVDETVNKRVTLSKCESLNVKAYSLPIEKYMVRKYSNTEKEAKLYNYNKILAINQVFDILANYHMSKDWPKSLEIGVPKRKGFILLNDLIKNGN